MKESYIEAHLVDAVEKKGGICWKFKPCGRRGVPDRIVVAKGRVYFVELKQPRGRLAELQELRQKEMLAAGAQVRNLWNLRAVEHFVRDEI